VFSNTGGQSCADSTNCCWHEKMDLTTPTCVPPMVLSMPTRSLKMYKHYPQRLPHDCLEVEVPRRLCRSVHRVALVRSKFLQVP